MMYNPQASTFRSFQPFPLQPAKPKATDYTCMKVTLLIFTSLFSLFSLFFLAVDIVAIKMSLDPGMTAFFWIVIVVFAIRMVTLINFWLTIFYENTSLFWFSFSWYILALGAVGTSVGIIMWEIYTLTKNWTAVFIHPFVLNFLSFCFVTIFALLYTCLKQWITAARYVMIPVYVQPNRGMMIQDEEAVAFRGARSFIPQA